MEEEFIAKALASVGRHVHQHDGVWWERVGPGFHKPIDRLRPIRPGDAKPAISQAWLGYSHAVPEGAESNHVWSTMMLAGDKLATFDLASIGQKRKQQKVKSSLKTLRITRLESIGEHLDAIAEINISTASRTGHGRPASYYRTNRAEWEAFMRSEHAIPGREWWAAFSGETLIAYYYVYVIARTLYLSAAKSHSDFLQFAPNDCLVFSVVKAHADARDCDRAIFGDWSPDTVSLNEFKERFGFVRTDLPLFRRETVGFRLGRWVQAWRAKQAQPAATARPAESEPVAETAASEGGQ